MSKRYEVRATIPGSLGFKRDFYTQQEAESAFHLLCDFLVLYWPCINHSHRRDRKLNGMAFAELTKITPGQDSVSFVIEVVDTEEPSKR
jgi:hypothetical protein